MDIRQDNCFINIKTKTIELNCFKSSCREWKKMMWTLLAPTETLLTIFKQNAVSMWPRQPQIRLMLTYSKSLRPNVNVLILETQQNANILTSSDLAPWNHSMFTKSRALKKDPIKFPNFCSDFFPALPINRILTKMSLVEC